jgi:hypothetical protein
MLRTADSDDDSVDDEEDIHIESTTCKLPLSDSSIDHVITIDDMHLQSIGDELQQLEEESDEILQLNSNNWKNTTAITLQKTIEELANKISMLNKHTDEMEIDELRNIQDKAKKELYFPNSITTFGSDGVYFAYDDFWLESISGQYEIELSPSMGTDCGKIIFLLSG